MAITYTENWAFQPLNTANAAVSSGSVSVAVDDVVLVMYGNADAQSGATYSISNTGTALSWTPLVSRNTTSQCGVASFVAVSASAQSIVVTVQDSNAGTRRASIATIVCTGAHLTNPAPAGNRFSGIGGTDVSQAITPTASGSLLWMFTADWAATDTFAAIANCTRDQNRQDAGLYTAALFRPTTQPRTDAAAFTIGETDTSGTVAWMAIEIQSVGDGSTPLKRNLPEFVAKGTFSGLATAPTPGMPTFNEGDLLVIAIESANQAIATPTGYTEFASSPQSTGTAAAIGGVRLGAFWRIAVAGDTAPTIADSGNHTCAQIYSIRGIDSANPVNITGGTTQAATTSVSFPTVTTTTDNCLILLLLANDRDIDGTTNISAQANAALASITEQHDQCISAGVGGGLCTTTGIKLLEGAVGATTATNAASVTNATLTIALQGSPKIPDWTITQKFTPLRM